MRTEIVGQWTEKVYGNVYRDSSVKMTLYTFTDNAFNDIPNNFWIKLLKDEITPDIVIQKVAGKKSKTTRGMIGAIESIEHSKKNLIEIINSTFKDTHLKALAIMNRFDYDKLKELLNEI